MTSSFTQQMGAAIIGIALFSSCSRPVAYFQRGPVDPALTRQSPAVVVTKPELIVDAPAESFAQAAETRSPTNAYVSVASTPAAPERLNERGVRMTNRLSSTRETVSPAGTQASRKMSGIQRLMLKKLNKRIGNQLASNQPERALVKTGKLVGSLVLLIVGLLLLILGSGTVAFIGLIVSLVGGVGTVVSLFGIDSY